MISLSAAADSFSLRSAFSVAWCAHWLGLLKILDGHAVQKEKCNATSNHRRTRPPYGRVGSGCPKDCSDTRRIMPGHD